MSIEMEVTFVGACNVDIYSKIPRLPVCGETLHGISMSRGISGKAINQAVQFVLLGPETKPAIVTAVGNDQYGQDVVHYFDGIGLNTEHVHRRADYATGTSLCLVLDDGEISRVVHPCPLTMDMLDASKDQIERSKIVVTSFEVGVDVALKAMRMARAAGATTVIKASPMPEQGAKEVFKHCNIVILNHVELEKVGSVEELLGLGVESVMVTLGADGAARFERGQEKGMNVAAPVVKAVDTTGAGDAFVGAFVFCLAKGMSREDAAGIACATASLSVQQTGGHESYADAEHPQVKALMC